MIKRALTEIAIGKSILLDQKCSTNPNRRLHWVCLDRTWFLLVYCPRLQTIVTALPTFSNVPYSPLSFKRRTEELMWSQYEAIKEKAS
jgi:hypothetical protein